MTTKQKLLYKIYDIFEEYNVHGIYYMKVLSNTNNRYTTVKLFKNHPNDDTTTIKIQSFIPTYSDYEIGEYEKKMVKNLTVKELKDIINLHNKYQADEERLRELIEGEK